MRYVMTATGILCGLFAVFFFVRPLAADIAFGTLFWRFWICAIPLTVVFCLCDCNDDNAIGPSPFLGPFAGLSASGIVGSAYLTLLGLPVLWLIGLAFWFRIMTGILHILGSPHDDRNEVVATQLVRLAKLIAFISSVVLLAVVANAILIKGQATTGAF